MRDLCAHGALVSAFLSLLLRLGLGSGPEICFRAFFLVSRAFVLSAARAASFESTFWGLLLQDQ